MERVDGGPEGLEDRDTSSSVRSDSDSVGFRPVSRLIGSTAAKKEEGGGLVQLVRIAESPNSLL